MLRNIHARFCLPSKQRAVGNHTAHNQWQNKHTQVPATGEHDRECPGPFHSSKDSELHNNPHCI